MALNQLLLPELDQEAASARKTLERIPEDKLEWAPHTKSMSLGKLAGHLAELPGWGAAVLGTDALDINPVGGPKYETLVPANRQQAVERFDAEVAKAREELSKISDEDLMKPWSLLSAGQTLFTMPRIVALRSFVFNHLIHHRAQLGVYLRLNDVPVPSVYGPSADEGQM